MTTTQKYVFGSTLGLAAVALTVGGAMAIDTSAQLAEDQNNDGERPAMGQRLKGGKEVFEAIQNRDYSAWAEAIADTPRADSLLEVINEDNFDRYVDMLEAKRDGNEEEFETIRQELGFPSKEEMEAEREVVKQALDDADYEAWKTAVADTGKSDEILEKIDTQEKFDLLVEMHQNNERNQEIREELDIDFGGKKGGHGSRGGEKPNN